MRSTKQFLLIAAMLFFANAETFDNAAQLTSDLLTGYNKLVRPVRNQAEAMQVNVTYDISGILDVNEVEGTFTLALSFTFNWMDSQIVWDIAAYNYTSTTVLPADSVWKPEIVFANPAGPVTALDSSMSSVRYYSTGTAIWYPYGVFQFSCPINIKYFPFDTQNCVASFMILKYYSTELNLYAVNKEATRAYFTDNGEWDLIKTESTVGGTGVSIFSIRVVMARRPTFMVIIIILPIIFLSLLNVMVFLLPPDSGERMSFTITILLALAVFMTIISDNIPKTSSPLSILSYFMCIQGILSTAICFVTLLNLRLFHKGDGQPVSTWILSCIRRCRGLRRSRGLNEDSKSTELRDSKIIKSNSVAVSNCEIVVADTCKLGKNSWTADAPNDQASSDVTWNEISQYVDWIMFIVSLVCFVITGIVFICLFAIRDSSET